MGITDLMEVTQHSKPAEAVSMVTTLQGMKLLLIFRLGASQLCNINESREEYGTQLRRSFGPSC